MINGVDDKPENVLKIRALGWRTSYKNKPITKSFLIKELFELSDNDYRKILASMNRVALLGKNCPKKYFEKDTTGRVVYEIKTITGIRVLCFPDKNKKILVCYNLYKKSQGGKKAQQRAFNSCFDMKRAYFKVNYEEEINS